MWSFSDDERLKYDKLLLATGGKPRSLGIPGITLPGSFLLRSRADAQRIRDAAEEAGRAVVIGAGFIGLEVAASLRKRGIEVTVVAPEPVPLPVFGERIGKRIQRLHAGKAVQFQLGKSPAEIVGSGMGNNATVREVALSDGTPAACRHCCSRCRHNSGRRAFGGHRADSQRRRAGQRGASNRGGGCFCCRQYSLSTGPPNWRADQGRALDRSGETGPARGTGYDGRGRLAGEFLAIDRAVLKFFGNPHF